MKEQFRAAALASPRLASARSRTDNLPIRFGNGTSRSREFFHRRSRSISLPFIVRSFVPRSAGKSLLEKSIASRDWRDSRMKASFAAFVADDNASGPAPLSAGMNTRQDCTRRGATTGNNNPSQKTIGVEKRPAGKTRLYITGCERANSLCDCRMTISRHLAATDGRAGAKQCSPFVFSSLSLASVLAAASSPASRSPVSVCCALRIPHGPPLLVTPARPFRSRCSLSHRLVPLSVFNR
jgi:hypothetical protein